MGFAVAAILPFRGAAGISFLVPPRTLAEPPRGLRRRLVGELWD